MSVRSKWSGKRDNGNTARAEAKAAIQAIADEFGKQFNDLLDNIGLEAVYAIINDRFTESRKSQNYDWIFNLVDKLSSIDENKKNIARKIINLCVKSLNAGEEVGYEKIQMLVMMAMSGIELPDVIPGNPVAAPVKLVPEVEFDTENKYTKQLEVLDIYNKLEKGDRINLCNALIEGYNDPTHDNADTAWSFISAENYKILFDMYNEKAEGVSNVFYAGVKWDFQRLTNTVKPYISKAWTDHEKLKLVVILTDSIRGDINLGVYGAIDFDSMQRPMGRPNIQSVHELIAAKPEELENLRSDIEQIVAESIIFQQDPLGWNNF